MGVPGYEDEYHEASGYNDSTAPWLDMSQEETLEDHKQFFHEKCHWWLVSIGGCAFQSQFDLFWPCSEICDWCSSSVDPSLLVSAVGCHCCSRPLPEIYDLSTGPSWRSGGPSSTPRPYIPWSCMGPMVSEDATEVDMKAVSHWQMAQNSLPIMLLLWAWLQCWSGMLFHGFQICQGSESIEHIMPMVVLVADWSWQMW